MAVQVDEMATTAAKPVLNGAGAFGPVSAAPNAGALDPALLGQITAFRTRLQAGIGERWYSQC